MARNILIAVVTLATATAACTPPPPAHWSPIDYRGRALAVDDAAEAFEYLMLTGRELSPIRVDVNRHFAILYFYRGHPGMLHFREIARAQMLRAVETGTFDVELQDADGRRLYRYTATTEARAHAFVDAVTTLVAQAPPPPTFGGT